MEEEIMSTADKIRVHEQIQRETQRLADRAINNQPGMSAANLRTMLANMTKDERRIFRATGQTPDRFEGDETYTGKGQPATAEPCSGEELLIHADQGLWIMQHADDGCTTTHAEFETLAEGQKRYPNARIDSNDRDEPATAEGLPSDDCEFEQQRT